VVHACGDDAIVTARRPATGGDTWWRWWKIALAVPAVAMIGALAFVYRFNTLGGTMGGFDNDHFAHLMRTEMLLRGAQPLRDFADAELRGAWPSLSYAVPAWAQEIGGRSLLSEAYLTVGALAIAAMVVFLLALDLSRQWLVGMLAALTAIATAPKLYNYPKVLTLAIGMLAIRIVASNPSIGPLVFAAAATAIATLFRHDYGAYLAVGITATLLARAPDGWRLMVRRVGTYAGVTTVFLLPSALWVQWYEGIPQYFQSALASSRLETDRTRLYLDSFDWLHPFTSNGLLLGTYLLFWAVLAVAAVLLCVRLLSTDQPISPERRAVAIGLLAMAAIVNVFFLRANLAQRFGDAAGPVVLLTAWAAGESRGFAGRITRPLATATPIAILAVMLSAASIFGHVASSLQTGGLSRSWTVTTARFGDVRADLSRLPPDTWQPDDAQGTLVAARYVAECTAPDDYLLVAAYNPEIPVFARRRFAAGQATVSLSFYKSEADQRRALARLQQQSVPIILADARDFDEGFVADYPLLAEYVTHAYRRAGTITVDHEPRFLVFAKADLPARGTDAALGLPCFR
jgi:hypothetical protein